MSNAIKVKMSDWAITSAENKVFLMGISRGVSMYGSPFMGTSTFVYYPLEEARVKVVDFSINISIDSLNTTLICPLGCLYCNGMYVSSNIKLEPTLDKLIALFRLCSYFEIVSAEEFTSYCGMMSDPKLAEAVCDVWLDKDKYVLEEKEEYSRNLYETNGLDIKIDSDALLVLELNEGCMGVDGYLCLNGVYHSLVYEVLDSNEEYITMGIGYRNNSGKLIRLLILSTNYKNSGYVIMGISKEMKGIDLYLYNSTELDNVLVKTLKGVITLPKEGFEFIPRLN